MPLYFFDISLPTPELDTMGSEFPDIHAARMAAVRLCGELIQEIDGKFWEEPVWQMKVADQKHRLLFTLTFSAEDQDFVV